MNADEWRFLVKRYNYITNSFVYVVEKLYLCKDKCSQIRH